MDLFIVNMGITHSVRNLPCLYILDLFQHGLHVGIDVLFRHIVDDRCNSLWNCLCRNHDDILVLCQIFCLICCQDNVLVVWQNEDVICIDRIDRSEHILCTWVHRLTSFDQIIHTKFSENLVHPFSDGYCNKPNRLARRFFRLFCCNFFRITDQLFLMLFSHVVNLHTGQLSVCESFFKGQSRMICMNVDLHNVFIRHTYDGISNGLQVGFKLHFICFCKGLICHNDKFCTISELDVRFSLRTCFGHLCSCTCFDRTVIDLFAKKCIIGAM